MEPRLKIFYSLLLAWSVTLSGLAASSKQIQRIPTPARWLGAVSSYDNMSKYLNATPLNGYRSTEPAFLGCYFSGPYVDRLNAFGLIAWDQMIGYNNGAALNGLNLGNGEWPGLGTAYVDRINAFPKLVWDSMTNYSNGQWLNGLNGGNNNGAGLVWSGPYVDHQPPVIITAVHCVGCGAFGCNILFSGGYAGANEVYFTTDGTTPNPSGTVCGGGLCLICPSVFDATTPGTWTFADSSCNQSTTSVQESMTINSGTVIQAVGSVDGTHFSPVSSFTYVSCP